MKIAVCIKQVVTREWQLRVNDQKSWIRDQDASFELNEPDAYALEEGLRLKEKHGGEVVVCCAGPARATQVVREALARGADRAIHVEDDGLATADANAVADALAGAIKAEQVDLVLVATTTPDEVMPNAAPLVAHELGAVRAGAFDIGAACTGFLSALAVGTGQIEAGRAQVVLVIGADFMSRILDPDDRTTAAVFADGAGAVVLQATGETGRIGPIVLGSDGAGADHIIVPREEGVIRMRGHETFREAVARLSLATVQAARAAGTRLDDIDLFVYHQANGRILTAVGERLGLPADRVVDCISQYGNTSAATLPLALAHVDEQGRLKPGYRVLLGAFGAGFTWGATVVEWSPPTPAA